MPGMFDAITGNLFGSPAVETYSSVVMRGAESGVESVFITFGSA